MRSWQVPTLIAWGGYELTESVSLELVWAPDFDPRFFMPVVGTFQSPADILGFGVESDFVVDLRPYDWVDQQQGGAAIRTVIPQLENMELGIYYYHYLSRWPMMGARRRGRRSVRRWQELDLVDHFHHAIRLGPEHSSTMT